MPVGIHVYLSADFPLLSITHFLVKNSTLNRGNFKTIEQNRFGLTDCSFSDRNPRRKKHKV